MKILSFAISFCLWFFWQSNFYNLTFKTFTGEPIQMSSFSGKKILIVPFKTKEFLERIDAIQKANTDILQVIAVPAIDFGDTVNAKSISTGGRLSLILTQPMVVKKGSEAQHPLFKWLTNVSANTHFDTDVKEEGQMFFVSSKGTLYAVLNKRAPASLIRDLINRNIKN